MGKIDELVVNFAVYEDAIEYLGMAEATLPDLEYLTEEISGAGIGGNVEEIIAPEPQRKELPVSFSSLSLSSFYSSSEVFPPPHFRLSDLLFRTLYHKNDHRSIN